MRALVLEEFGRLAVADLPRPVPGPGEVLLRIHATGICGSDLHGFTGENGRRAPGQVMGHESVGRIAGVGEGVSPADFPPGAAATFNPVLVPEAQLEDYRGREQQAPGRLVIGVARHLVSSFAEYLALPARNVVTIGEDTPIEYGALVEPLAVAAHAVVRAGVRSEHKVLILGGGPVGQSIVIAVQQVGGTDIVVSEMNEDRRELCARLGARVINPSRSAVSGQVAELFGGRADVAIDAVGVTPTMRDALESTEMGGTVCLVGMGAQHLEVSAFAISTEERSVVGSFTYTADDFIRAAGWVRDGVADFGALVSKVVNLDEANDEFVRQTEGQPTAGKVLVRFAEGEYR